MNRALVSLSLVLFVSGALPAAADVEGMRRDAAYLASGELSGRLTGTEGAEQAAKYIAEQLKQIGARPLEGQDGFGLPFEFTAGMSDGGSRLALRVEGREPQEWTGTEQIQGLSFSDSGEVSGPVVFAGYGLVVPEGQDFSYDSFHGLDLKDKIAVVLRYYPEDSEGDMRNTLSRYSGLRYKAMQARERGAKAILVITGPRSPNAGETVPMAFDTALSGSGIVAASASGAVAEALFAAIEGKDLEAVQKSLDDANPHVGGFELPGVSLSLTVKVNRERRVAENIVGVLPATLREGAPADGKVVLLGAHYDHLGKGGHGASLARKEEAGQTHHGADDNASGVAVLLEIARRLVQAPLSRPVVFGFWAGEELGLVGSTTFVNDGVLPVDRVMAYVNFDMVGRMQDDRLSLQSVASSSVWPRLIEQSNVPVGLDLGTTEDPYLPTDSTPFYQSETPVLNFFTGSHEDYHRPTDTADRLNYEGMDAIAELGTLLTRKVAALAEAPDYQAVERKSEERAERDGVRAFTGTIPDYTREVDGLLLSGVIGGGPADKAGLKGGDVIVEFAGKTIANIYDYTYALEGVKIGIPIKVVFMRDGERHEVEVVPTTRN